MKIRINWSAKTIGVQMEQPPILGGVVGRMITIADCYRYSSHFGREQIWYRATVKKKPRESKKTTKNLFEPKLSDSPFSKKVDW